MYFQHAPELWQQFPQLVPGLLVVEGIHPQVDVAERLKPFYARARAHLATGSESELPAINAWRRAYTQMGMKPTQYRAAAEALLRRFRKEDRLPLLHPLVDICNAISIAFALPIAAFDLDQVASFLEVRYAHGDEQYLAFHGENEVPSVGEVIFADADNHAHARRWTFRQSRRSTINDSTQRVLIISEALHANASMDMSELLSALVHEISAVWQAPKQQTILRAIAPRLDF